MRGKKKTSDLNVSYVSVVEHYVYMENYFLWSFLKLTVSWEATPSLKLTSCDALISPVRYIFH